MSSSLAEGSPFFLRFQRLTAWSANALNKVSMAALVLLMLMLAADAVMRYTFSAPIPGATELDIFALVTLVFTGMAYTAVKKGHVRIDIVYERLQPRIQAILDSITSLLSLIILGLIAWQTVLRAGRSWAAHDATPTMFIPFAPFMLVVAFGCAVWALVILSDLFDSITRALEGKHPRARLGLIAGSVLTLLLGAALAWHWLPFEITPVTAGIAAFVILIPLLFSGMQVGFVLLFLGFLGLSALTNFGAGAVSLGHTPFTEGSEYGLAVIPLFVLMGELVFVSGLGRDLYSAARQWVGQLRGGLASATIGACAGFAAVCGSTVATAVTMCTIAWPEMKRYKYAPALAGCSIAAGGVIGTMIPPSVAFIIYGVITQESIGQLFVAGIIPGLIMTALFMITISFMCWRNPKLGPPAPSVSIKEKVVGLRLIWPVLALFFIVMGGIYLGVFSAVEAGGIGALGALVIPLLLRRLSWKDFTESLHSTIVVTCMVFLLFIGGTVFGKVIAVSQLPFMVANYVASSGFPRLGVLLLVLAVFFVLGMVMPSYPAMILVVPIVFPVIMALGYDPIWFGVQVVLQTEIGALTPPVAINIFAVAGAAKDIPMGDMYRGIWPFVGALLVLVALLIAFPQIALFLPKLMMG